MAKSNTALFDEGGAPKAPPAKLKKLIARGKELADAERAVEALSESLASAKVRLQHLKTEVMPELMAEIQQTEFTMEDGVKIAIKDFVAGSLPKDDGTKEGRAARARAIKFIEKNDGGPLIKTEVSMAFDKSQHNAALSFVADMKAKLEEYGLEETHIDVVSGVHPQTLIAYAKEKLEKGGKIDLKLLGLHSGRYAKVTFPKDPKPKPKK